MSIAKNKLKIAFLFDDSLDRPDGVQQYVLLVGQWLTAQGHQVYYLCGESYRNDLSNIVSISSNITVRFNGNRMTIPFYVRKKDLIDILNNNFDVWHIQMPYSPMLTGRIIKYYIKNKLKLPILCATFHIYSEKYLIKLSSKVLAKMTETTTSKINLIYSASLASEKFCLENYHRNSKFLGYPIDFNRFYEAQPLKKYSHQKIQNILFIGRLVPRKGCLQLLKAVKFLKEDLAVSNFRVLICGHGPLLHQLQKYTEVNHLKHIVHFEGYVTEEDKPKYYASSDITVFPSLGGESFGIVLLEALASGKSVVLAGNNYGYSNVLKQKPELLFNPLQPDILAKKIAYFLTAPVESKSLKQWGQIYAKQFDINLIGKKIESQYYMLLRNQDNK